ncbi:Gfo/Idh/MocA family protein [Naumannella huperziae]
MRIGLAGVGRIGAFHAETLAGLDFVDALVITDPRADAASALADRVDATTAASVDELLDRVDAFVIAAATPVHAELLRAGIAAGIPTFCEKPVAGTLAETSELARLAETATAPIQVGFQRRFDAGYRAARAAVAAGELGFVHTLRANTLDERPPDRSYLPGSGGIFRDCSIHDFDIIRFVTGQEFVSAYAVGANQGEPFFAEAGDVDTGAAVLTLENGPLVLASAGRYNGAGHDVRLELLGERDSLAVGLDDTLALRSAEPGRSGDPARGVVHSFMERFAPAYVAELTEFAEVARGNAPSPCTLADALQAFRVAEACARSLAEGRPVALAEVTG